MKNILLYGDSFFWGVDTSSGSRHEYKNQIGTIVQEKLGAEFSVVTEGLRGRTMFGENGWFPERNGLAQFGPIFASHLPLDAIVIMLGTNDLNSKTRHRPEEIAGAIDTYKEKMQFWCDFMKYDIPSLVIVAPPAIDENCLSSFKEIFERSAPIITNLSYALKMYSQKSGDTFFDASNVVVSKNTDGIHISAEENKKLGEKIADVTREVV